MKKQLFSLAALGLALFGWLPAALAGPQVLLCSPARSANSSAAQVGVPGLSTSYAADSAGCVLANGVGDISVLRAAGYAEPGKLRSLVFNTGVQTGTTSFLVGTLPAGAYIQKIVWQNVTANAAGSLSIGSTSGGTDVVGSTACGANCLTDATLAKTLFSASSTQPLYVTSSGWNSANVNVTVVFGFF
jgi:hypothetical protein